MKTHAPGGVPMREVFAQMEADSKKKNLKNWLDNKFPKGWCDYSPMYVITHPWKAVEYWYGEIKHAYQRAFRGWDDTAVWSIDFYLAKIIPELVTELKNKKAGVPTTMLEGLPHDKNFNYSDESFDIATERWNKILDEIVEGFEVYDNNIPYSTMTKEEAENYKKFEHSFDLFRKHFSSLWW